jgi:E3 ubiquitin-protein ligase BIG BROTHER-like protein
MQEEEAEFQRRMMVLAGVQYPGTSPRGHGAAVRAVRAEGAEDSPSHLDSGDEEDGGGIDSDDDIPDPDSMSYEELTALGEVVGTVSTGLTQDQIDSLPVMKYLEVCYGGQRREKQVSEEVAEEEEEQCAVCRVEFEEEDEVKKLPCGHYYHPECVGQWLQQKKICPQCSREVTCGNVGAAAAAASLERTRRPPLAAVAPATALAPHNN